MWSSDLRPEDIEDINFTWLPPWLLEEEEEDLGLVMRVGSLGGLEKNLMATTFPSVVL